MATRLDPKRLEYTGVRLKELGIVRVKQAQLVAAEGQPDLISGPLILASGIRESGLRNAMGDEDHHNPGHFRAHGVHQINETYYMYWLKTVPGCPAGHIDNSGHWHMPPNSWHAQPGKTAGDRDYGPRFIDSCRQYVRIIDGYVEQAHDHGIELAHEAIQVALASFNTGFGGALEGYLHNNVDMHTANNDYVKDTLMRKAEINHWLHEHPNWMI